MDIFKLIFEHDLTLEQLSGNHDPRRRGAADAPSTIEQFLRPEPTFCRYYFTGTRFPENHFGLNSLSHAHELLDTLVHALPPTLWHNESGDLCGNLARDLMQSAPHCLFISGETSDPGLREALRQNHQTGIREQFEPLTRLLTQDHMVLITEKAHHGTDLHLFSRHNLYEPFFHAYQKLVSPDLRFFSINGRRVSSERHFYFETWTLERPPHGFMEVTAQARLR